MKWEPDMIARAAALWKEGFTYTQIADELRCTRGAISGLTNRHPDKFPLRKIPQRVKTRQEECSSAAPSLRRAVKVGAAIACAAPADLSPIINAPVPNLPATMPITYLEALFADRCLHFVGDPLGTDGPEMPVCGAERAEGVFETRYCRRHLDGQYQARAAA